MKFSTITISALSIIASATQVNARRRRLNTIKGDEPDASMSYMLSPARGSSKSKSATGSPTSAPIPEVCDLCFLCCMERRYDDDDIKHISLTTRTFMYTTTARRMQFYN